MKNLAVIDANYICHMAKHTMGGLTYGGEDTGIMFGFLKSLIKIAEVLNPDITAFAWDSHKSLRRWIYPEYKANRGSDEDLFVQERIIKQFQMTREVVVPGLGFKNSYLQDGFEGDDLIAHLCYPNNKYESTIVSSDHDLLQLINPHCSMYNIVTGEMVTEGWVIKRFGIESKRWSLVKSIAGCGTDNVAGVKGVGEKTAVKYLNGELKETTKAYKSIEENEEIINRNFDLVDLPMKGSKPISIREDELSVGKFIEICDRFGFKSLLNPKIFKIWEDGFCKNYEDDIPF